MWIVGVGTNILCGSETVGDEDEWLKKYSEKSVNEFIA